jgi:two-component system response regulator AtoC
VALIVPPLRQRPEDILPLALFFLDHFNRKFGKNTGSFSPETIAAMESAYWSGNVRELKHSVERAVVSNAGGPIVPADLGIISATFQDAAPASQLLPFRDARDRFERAYFTNLLQVASGNVSEAARLSGIARQNFHTHIKRLGIVIDS